MTNDIYIAAGKRTPFVKAGGSYAHLDGLQVSAPVLQAMGSSTDPDLVVWGQVIPSMTVSNIARELVLEAGLRSDIPAYSTVLACSISMAAALQAGAMLGRGDTHLAVAGGVETMSRVPIGLTDEAAAKLSAIAATDPAGAMQLLKEFTPQDFHLPIKGWVNRISKRSMGDHTEDTAKTFNISRTQQDELAFQSHKKAAHAQKDGFFDDLIIPIAGVSQDALVRADSTLEKLSTLQPVFDRKSGSGSLTAGNSSPLTDGAAGVYVADRDGLRRLGDPPAMRLVDWQLAAMDYKDEGILMAPARSIPKLLDRHGLRFEDVQVWEIHEAFAAQVAANVQAISNADYRKAHAGVTTDLGAFPWERLNPNGGSLALGHPFAATGARLLSQVVKELDAMESGAKAVVSICADGGQGSVALFEKP